MNIKTKLLFSFIFIAGLSSAMATFTAIYSISQKYQDMAEAEIIVTRKNVESSFYDYLSEMTRKASLMSGLKETENYQQNRDELEASLNSKIYFLDNINVNIIDADKKIIYTYLNSTGALIRQENLLQLPFFAGGKDPLIRDVGIFVIDGKLCMQVISPIVRREEFSFEGYLLMEMPLNTEFTDQLKHRTRGHVVIRQGETSLSTTFMDEDGKRFFPDIEHSLQEEPQQIEIMGQAYLVDHFPIVNHEKTLGHVFVAANINDIILARKLGVRNILLVLAFVTVIGIVMSIVAGRRLTRSIQRLSSGAETISRGNFDLNIKPSSNDEIGRLTILFNNMTRSLRGQTEEIVGLKLFFETVIEKSPSAIIICDVVSHAITINPAAEKLFGISKEKVEGKELFETLPFPYDLQSDFYQVIITGQPVTYESYHIALPEQDEKILHITFYQVALKEKISIAIQVEDLTASFKMEQELVHSQKMGTLGETLSRFTHEFNNLMTGIIGHVSLLKRITQKKTKNFKRVTAIEELANKAQELGKNILGFSKKKKMETQRFGVKELVNSILRLVESSLFKGITIKWNYHDGDFFIMANREQVQLAILNLLINARDALSEYEQQVPTIRISVEPIKDFNLINNFVMINIEDNGCGIEKKNLRQIFKPYFTTKGNRGTGLGLATVKDIIEKSNGTISVKSKPGQGTTFSICFPEQTEIDPVLI